MAHATNARRLACSLGLALLLLCCPPNAVAQEPPPQLPAHYYGPVHPNSAQVFTPTAGMAVTAWINGTRCGETQTILDANEVVYQVTVVDAVSSGRPGCGTDGQTVSFKVDHFQMQPTAIWQSGLVQALPLTLGTPGPCPDFSAPGGVGIEDIQAIASHWNQVEGGPGWEARYDLSGDHQIDIVDIMLATAAWGQTCPSHHPASYSRAQP
jgi:hypothetical protein